eukprot:m.85611 g.85611  ORF g.85611 m.85611 type:complete len:163 (+) comp50884_c0_seq1:393-881(+)
MKPPPPQCYPKLVETPAAMVQQVFRVLKSRGAAAFTVWGRPELSPKFELIPSVFKEFGVSEPAKRSNFHLNDVPRLRQLFFESGFSKAVTWYQPTVPVVTDGETFLQQTVLSGSPYYRELLGRLDEATQAGFLAELRRRVDALLSSGQTLSLDSIVVVVHKP